MAAGGLEGELEDLVCQLECHAGRKVPAGYNADLRFMSHLWDPLRHVYRFGANQSSQTVMCRVALWCVVEEGFELCFVRHLWDLLRHVHRLVAVCQVFAVQCQGVGCGGLRSAVVGGA